ncbi:uncharacterized protein LOC118194539 [Stegodyphus dumicola]|uniref:uncharacterized protein LOC118194539 n=1 Tax=Stegodyphus dumicola TaxID=202533 RepID=UPI0015ADA250|nr:uncharacterized protein LOC118194539 [Stegodyphus dumicola]
MAEDTASENKQESSSKYSERRSDAESANTGPSGLENNELESTLSVRDLFDWNPNYFKHTRGIINVITLVLNLIILIMISVACQLYTTRKLPEYFLCYPADTFLFVVACSSFTNATLLVFCCVLSSKTNQVLYNTSYEIGYYAVYCVLYFASGVGLVSNVINRNKGHVTLEPHYTTTLAGGIIGIINCLLYGASAVWFVICHL